MYDLNDTIVAVSSPSSGAKAIVRITGPDTIAVCNLIFANFPRQQTSGNDNRIVSGPVSVKSRTRDDGQRTRDEGRETSLLSGTIAIDGELKVDAKLYLFLAPHSYTGDDVAEIHIHTNAAVTEALMGNLLSRGLRMAGPGEFTARAYLNGKIDLAQAEAVNEIVVSSNKFQLAAAEKLLAGRLAETTAKLRSSIMESLSLIEAGLDFSGEDIEFITRPEAVERIVEIKDQLERLLCGSIRYESVIDLPAVGIAGAPYAGKSSLINKLLGKERSIVSHTRKTTRDVLTGLLTLVHCRCVLFDCAGLILEPENILDELTQQAAIEALRKSAVVVFCVDVSQDTRPKTQDPRRKTQDTRPKTQDPRRKTQDTRYESQDFGSWDDEVVLWSLVRSLGAPVLIPVGTKCDLVSEHVLSNRLAELNELFGIEVLATSTETGLGLEKLRNTIDEKLIGLVLGGGKRGTRDEGRETSLIALTARHRQAVTEAIENIGESINELQAGNDEVAAMMLRATYKSICDIEQQHVDEEILDRIFSRFCIGK
jgi:tRNA modification GTPase